MLSKQLAALIVLAAGIAINSPSYSNTYLDYSEWQNRTEEARVNYIMGMYDLLVTLADSDAGVRRGRHYGACVSKAKMSNRDLAENVRLFGASRPELHSQPVTAVLIQYLIGLCGKPPSAN